MYKTEKFPNKQIDKSYTWLEKEIDSLNNFVTAMKATPATTVGFSMIIDKNTKSSYVVYYKYLLSYKLITFFLVLLKK